MLGSVPDLPSLKNLPSVGGGDTTPGGVLSVYARPGGVFTYHRPGGANFYVRP